MLTGSAIDSETIVLIVENDPSDKRMLKNICAKVGFTFNNIWVVEELAPAIGMLNQGVVDLVLLDLALEDDINASQAVTLLQRWKNETKKKKIPVIVVSRLTEMLMPAAEASCAAVISKPGPTDGEIAQFSNFLQHVIREAISKRSVEVTLGERIRQQFDRIVKRLVPGSPHIHFAPGVSIPVSNPLIRAGVAVFVVVCWAVFLITFAKTQGWPIKPVIWSFGALLLVVILWAVIPRKRTH
jgi:CheY-like chemotaxis protein